MLMLEILATQHLCKTLFLWDVTAGANQVVLVEIVAAV